MANGFYTDFKRSLQNKEQDMDTDDIRALLIDDADYTHNANQDFLDDIPGGARVAVSGALAGATISSVGGFDTNDFSWATVSGDVSERVSIYNHGVGGSDAARRLCAFYDTLTGLPITPNGANINFTVHASGWWTL